jgi:hypothetical protein
MPGRESPIIAIVGNAKTHADAPAAAEALGRELAKAGFRILVYSSLADYVEARVVTGYLASNAAGRRSIVVRYPLDGARPEFAEQSSHAAAFDWRPEDGHDWEISFYQSLNEVDGVLLIGGGNSTMIAGLVAMGRGIAMLAAAGFHGKASEVWGRLSPGRDLVTADEKTLMARPSWTEDDAAELAGILKAQIARKEERERQRLLEQRRRETSVSLNAGLALVLFLLSMGSVAVAWGVSTLSPAIGLALLFVSPLLAGVSGSTVRLVFDRRQGADPLSSQTAITTAALGLIAGGVAGLLFIIAQVTTATAPAGQVVAADQVRKLVPFTVLIGFVAGLTLDAVFRKLISTDVVDTTSIEVKKRL